MTMVGSRIRLETNERLIAALVLAEPGIQGLPPSLPIIHVTNARRALSALVNAFAHRIERNIPFTMGPDNSIHPSAVVEGVLEGGVTVGAGAIISKGCFVGRGSRIEPRAVLMPQTQTGRNCVIQSGAVIGCAGFGFFDDGGPADPIPHLAGVILGDNCFIGANTVIAAGVLHPTLLGSGCKLDSHVQIAHNVRLGNDCLMASQSGIAGSTVVGDGFRMGGAASVAGHLRLGKNVGVAARSGVTKDLADHAVVAGFPAMPIRSWRRRETLLRRMEKDGFLPQGEWA